MKWRPWMWYAAGIPAALLLVTAAGLVTNAHQVQRKRTVGIEGEAGQPHGTWGVSRGDGLMESMKFKQAAATPVKKTAGIDIQDKPSAVPVPATPLKLIRTGGVSVEVPDFEKAAKELGQLVASVGGYLADTQVQRLPSGTRTGTLSLRVPAAAYESVGSRIRALGKVTSERSNVEDVTKAYADLETRLWVKREALNRIRELLRVKAGNLKEVLEAEREISRITEEIEQAEGERRFFDHQIQLSTITVELSEPMPLSFARPSSWEALSEAMRDSAAMIAGSLAFMLRLVLILLPWAAVTWAIVFAVRWIRKRRRAAMAQESSPSGDGQE